MHTGAEEYVALFSFEGECEDELAFLAGQVIWIVEKCEDGYEALCGYACEYHMY